MMRTITAVAIGMVVTAAATMAIKTSANIANSASAWILIMWTTGVQVFAELHLTKGMDFVTTTTTIVLANTMAVIVVVKVGNHNSFSTANRVPAKILRSKQNLSPDKHAQERVLREVYTEEMATVMMEITIAVVSTMVAIVAERPEVTNSNTVKLVNV